MTLRRNVRNWLLWLALLLPIAQALAGVHALSHAGERQGDGVAHLAHCDLCLTAANLGSNAPANKPSPLRLEGATHVAPQPVAASAPRAADAGLPPARAPPAAA